MADTLAPPLDDTDLVFSEVTSEKTFRPDRKLQFEEDFNRLLKISETLQDSDPDEGDDSSGKEVDAEEGVIIPEENKLPVASYADPLQSAVSPEYVKKVMRELDYMSVEMLKQALRAIKVPTSGRKTTLRKRVAECYRKENMVLQRKETQADTRTCKYFDYLVAIDFECTCVEVMYDYPHEIIEFPAVLIDVKDMKVISEFRTYVRPVKNPILSDFCVGFTKIAQQTVDEAPTFREALHQFLNWMQKNNLGESGKRYAFVTDGPHDMWKFMQFQCILAGMKMPHMFRSYINVKKIFKEKFNGLVKGNGKSGIENMLEKFGRPFEGNKHSGLDDARNIAQICIEMLKRRVELRINQRCAHQTSNNNQGTFHEDAEDEDMNSRPEVDISQRDYQMWMRKLPLKLTTVTKKEFMSREYADCESCEEDTDEQHPKNTPEWISFARDEIGSINTIQVFKKSSVKEKNRNAAEKTVKEKKNKRKSRVSLIENDNITVTSDEDSPRPSILRLGATEGRGNEDVLPMKRRSSTLSSRVNRSSRVTDREEKVPRNSLMSRDNLMLSIEEEVVAENGETVTSESTTDESEEIESEWTSEEESNEGMPTRIVQPLLNRPSFFHTSDVMSRSSSATDSPPSTRGFGGDIDLTKFGPPPPKNTLSRKNRFNGRDPF